MLTKPGQSWTVHNIGERIMFGGVYPTHNDGTPRLFYKGTAVDQIQSISPDNRPYGGDRITSSGATDTGGYWTDGKSLSVRWYSTGTSFVVGFDKLFTLVNSPLTVVSWALASKSRLVGVLKSGSSIYVAVFDISGMAGGNLDYGTKLVAQQLVPVVQHDRLRFTQATRTLFGKKSNGDFYAFAFGTDFLSFTEYLLHAYSFSGTADNYTESKVLDFVVVGRNGAAVLLQESVVDKNNTGSTSDSFAIPFYQKPASEICSEYTYSFTSIWTVDITITSDDHYDYSHILMSCQPVFTDGAISGWDVVTHSAMFSEFSYWFYNTQRHIHSGVSIISRLPGESCLSQYPSRSSVSANTHSPIPYSDFANWFDRYQHYPSTLFAVVVDDGKRLHFVSDKLTVFVYFQFRLAVDPSTSPVDPETLRGDGLDLVLKTPIGESVIHSQTFSPAIYGLCYPSIPRALTSPGQIYAETDRLIAIGGVIPIYPAGWLNPVPQSYQKFALIVDKTSFAHRFTVDPDQVDNFNVLGLSVGPIS